MLATQPPDTRQRKNTDKAAEALHYLVKLSLLGQKMVEISASQSPQSESSPKSKLSYPANIIPSTYRMEVVDLGPHNPSPTPILA